MVVIVAILVAGIFAIIRTGNLENQPINNEQEQVGELNINEPKNQTINKEMEQINGLDITVLQEGSGEIIENGSVAVMHYTGTLDDGTVFDSSIPRGVPFEFTLGAGQVIAGWDIGILGMRVGEKRRLIIAPELAYGPVTRGPIPANSTLTFEVELLEIK